MSVCRFKHKTHEYITTQTNRASVPVALSLSFVNTLSGILSVGKGFPQFLIDQLIQGGAITDQQQAMARYGKQANHVLVDKASSILVRFFGLLFKNNQQ